MKKLARLTAGALMTVLLALPAMATDSAVAQQPVREKRPTGKTSAGKVPQSQKEYQQKRAAAKNRRDQLLKKRQQTINSADQAAGAQ